MAAWSALLEVVQILKLIPAGVVAASHIGLARPSKAADLPAIVAVVNEIKESTIGIGGLASNERIDADHWRDVSGSRATGTMLLEIWAATPEKVIEVADAVFQRMKDAATDLREKGFIRFDHREVRPIEESRLGLDEAGRAFKMAVGFAIIYEEIKTDTVGPGGIIKRVHVEINDSFQEEMDIQ